MNCQPSVIGVVLEVRGKVPGIEVLADVGFIVWVGLNFESPTFPQQVKLCP